MLHLLALAGLGGVFVLLLVLALMHVSGWRLGDARDVVLNRAYASFMHDGVVIPGVRPGRGALLTIRLLASDGDTRRELAQAARGPTSPATTDAVRDRTER